MSGINSDICLYCEVSMRYYNDYNHMIESMKNTWQIPDKQTVYEHCEVVQKRAVELYNHIVHHHVLTSWWCLPDWVHENAPVIRKEIVSLQEISRYTLYHDCGKPLVAKYENGKMKFPAHEWYSSEVYKSWLKKDRRVYRLILNDMLIHRSKATDIEKIMSIRERVTLLLVSLCEVHSNAELFGGSGSDSFKIKYKKVAARGEKIFKGIKDEY